MADHALCPNDTSHHRSDRWLRRCSLLFALLAVTAMLLPTVVAAPFQTGDGVADTVVPPEEDASQRPEIVAALKKLQDKDVPGALESLEAASEKYPDLAPARVIMAQIFIRSNSANAVKAAHAQLDQAVVDHPQDPEAYLILGSLALRSQLMTEAGLLFAKGTELVDAFEGDEARVTRCRLLSASGMANLAEVRQQWEAAEQHLREMIAVSEENAAAHKRLGRTLFMLGSAEQREEAYKEFSRAAELNENENKAEVALGQLYANDDGENSAKKAAEWFSYAVKQSPEHVPTRIQMAQHLVNTGDPEAALVHTLEAVRLDPTSKEARLALGQVHRYLGQHAEAQVRFESVHLESPSNFEAVNWLALSLADQDDPDKQTRALELIQITLNQMPNNHPSRAEAVATAGWIYHRLDQAENAEKALDSAVKSRRVGQDAHYHFARVLAKKGDAAGAKVVLGMALDNKSPFIYRRDAEKLLQELE